MDAPPPPVVEPPPRLKRTICKSCNLRKRTVEQLKAQFATRQSTDKVQRQKACADSEEMCKLRMELAAAKAAKKHWESASQACTRVMQAVSQQKRGQGASTAHLAYLTEATLAMEEETLKLEVSRRQVDKARKRMNDRRSEAKSRTTIYSACFRCTIKVD